MKQFFTDRQVRKFTLKEKFVYIFKQLQRMLTPIEDPYNFNYITIAPKYFNGPIHTKRIPVFIINEKGADLINNVELPFIDITIKFKDGLIQITGEKFCYKFPPEMMPEIWRRLKRML